MPKSSESINRDLEELLVSKVHNVTTLDSSGKETPTSDLADVFQFHFHSGGKDLGTVTASIDGLQKLTIYYDDQIAGSGATESDEDRGMNGTSWISLIKQLKKFAQQHQLGFVLKNSDRLRSDMKRRQQTKKLEEAAVKELTTDLKDMTDSEFKETYKMTKAEARAELKPKKQAETNTQTKLDEGYYGNRKMSYNDVMPEVKMIIKHNRQLEETDQRFRHIERIFLETSLGERFSVPTNKPSRARMFARHIAEGGQYRDDRWSHLNEICEDLDKLGGFVRATQNNHQQFNESAQQMISEAQEQYTELRETAKRLASSRGYSQYFESYAPRTITEDDSDLAEAFMHSTIDMRIESALPTLSKFGIRVGKIAESDMFAEWADDLVNETLDPYNPRQIQTLIELLSDTLPVGPNADVAIGELEDVIEDEELYNRLRATAKADPNVDARPQIVAWMQEQDKEKYRQVLDKINAADQEQATTQKNNPPSPRPQQPPKDEEPSMNEGDYMLENIRRLLGK